MLSDEYVPTKSNQSYPAMLLTKLKVCYLQRHKKNWYLHLTYFLNSTELTAETVILCLQMSLSATHTYILVHFLYLLAYSAARFSVSFEVNFYSTHLLSTEFQIILLLGNDTVVKGRSRKMLRPVPEILICLFTWKSVGKLHDLSH